MNQLIYPAVADCADWIQSIVIYEALLLLWSKAKETAADRQGHTAH